jgi:transposase InsO family protein
MPLKINHTHELKRSDPVMLKINVMNDTKESDSATLKVNFTRDLLATESDEDGVPLCLKCNSVIPLQKTVAFELMPNTPAISQKPYPLSRVKDEWSRTKVRELLDRGLIRYSRSKFAAPCTLPPKGPNNYRLCVNYKGVNECTVLDPHPFPKIDDMIDSLGGCTCFSVIDLCDAFWQLPLTEDTKKFSAFILPCGHFEWNVLPFGWKNSPALFQRIITQVLADLLDNTTFAYIDDICVGGRTKEECQEKTEKVLAALKKHGFEVNQTKSVFFKPSVRFVGRVIDGQTKTTREASIEKMRNMRRPEDVHDVFHFTGLAGYFRAFIKGYASIARPLEELKQKDREFVWTEACEEAYQFLKKKITSNPILSLPDWKLPFELWCDASGKQTGSVLVQREPDKPPMQQLRLIGYYTYSLSKAEQNYSVSEKEALAVKKAIEYFRTHLDGRQFTVFTDHQALTHLLGMKEAKGRLARWQNFLLQFDMVLKYRPGRDMQVPDALSRLCFDEGEQVCNLSHDVKRRQVTKEEIPKILAEYHDSWHSGGHDGVTRTYLKIRQRFFWQGMRETVTKYVMSCDACQTEKFKFRPRPDQLTLPVHSTSPFHSIHLDFGELRKKGEGRATTWSFLVAVDEHTKYCAVSASRETSAAVIHFLENHPQFKNCREIISDNGSAFVSSPFLKWAMSKDITLRTTSPYAPFSNGLAENKVRQIKTFCSLFPNFPGGWKKCLEAAADHENRSFNVSIGCSPHFRAFGKSLPLKADENFGIAADSLPQEKMKSPEEIKKYREKMRENFNRRHPRNNVKINPGDDVRVRLGVKGKNPIVIGPFKVKEVLFKEGLPKTVIFIDENGQERPSHIRNTLKVLRRSEEKS